MEYAFIIILHYFKLHTDISYTKTEFFFIEFMFIISIEFLRTNINLLHFICSGLIAELSIVELFGFDYC